MAYKFYNHMLTQHDPVILFTALSVQFAAINHLLFFSTDPDSQNNIGSIVAVAITVDVVVIQNLLLFSHFPCKLK